MTNLKAMGQRIKEIETRVKEIELEAPSLDKAYRDAIISRNRAEIMICQIAMAARITEVKALSREIQRIRKTLRT